MLEKITIDTARTSKDLQDIIDLQNINLLQSISPEEMEKEGFLTVRHDLQLLEEMNDADPHIVARSNGRVVAYALSMNRSFRQSIPLLEEMFDSIDAISYDGRLLANSKYLVMGQICIDKKYRGLGLFTKLYDKMSDLMASKYNYIVTEVSIRNKRSLQAHAKVGFKEIKRYTAGEDEWSLIIREI